ncbi:acetyl-CoA carboxylase biotin carboxyl carrier protein subunit (plasmid) [Sinorhizobium numidicum]|uniref:Biotin carboxyl carrier protein of acetyl-CoA carboxylase n=1 Tax=Sinorhizobium numidicum TaxID=680248 RepID=A0ABY8D6C9_9HYPH|nr:biotin/lipoyl-containing protein [Sinorhizobium numidicum]WEX79396.1 acetyl-CoA carboxylase biotin carboxyl carrier protein subunit [Sinorhizobium numidicum]WEX85647.1 acetyl-CoA carboxylase biotin carboxyl carrier protein subunit [Sinorhizobium numidicum]
MDLETIRTLIEFVGRSHVSELVVSEDGVTVRISNATSRRLPSGRTSTQGSQRIAEPTPADVVDEAERDATGGQTVKAPAFGVLHRSPNPGAPAFVEVGDAVEVGQSLCIVEAMKVFNTVSAHKSGPITRIFVSDGEEVEAGQPLMEIG